jgi:hypothetical protein
VSTTAPPVLPARSVATARSATLPSSPTFQEASYGAVVSVPSETQEPLAQSALASEQRKSSTPVTSPFGVDALTVNGSSAAPPTYAPGARIATAGAVLSTWTPETGSDTVLLPARSVAVTRRSYAPSASAVVCQAAGVSVHAPAPAGETSYVRVATPEPESSALEASATVRWTQAPGSLSAALGALLSTPVVSAGEAVRLPARSTATTRTS